MVRGDAAAAEDVEDLHVLAEVAGRVADGRDDKTRRDVLAHDEGEITGGRREAGDGREPRDTRGRSLEGAEIQLDHEGGAARVERIGGVGVEGAEGSDAEITDEEIACAARVEVGLARGRGLVLAADLAGGDALDDLFGDALRVVHVDGLRLLEGAVAAAREHRREGRDLVGEVAILRELKLRRRFGAGEDAGTHGEDVDVGDAVTAGSREGREEAGEERRAHHVAILGERVLDRDGGGGRADGREILLGDHAVREAFGEAEGRRGVADAVLEDEGVPRGRGTDRGEHGGERVDAADAHDLFDEVRLDRNVGAVVRWDDIGRSVRRLAVHRADVEAEVREDLGGLREGDGGAEEGGDALLAEVDRGAGVGAGARDDGAGDALAAREVGHERGRVREDVREIVRVDAALEAVAGLAVEAVAAARSADAARGEVRALDEHAGGGVADLAPLAAHDARERDGALGVGDDEIVRGERAIDAVEGAELLALGRAADDDLAAAEEGVIEGVDGVAELEHHEVGDVDDVVDGADPEALQAVFEPQGRRADRDVDDGGRAVGRAALEVVDGDAHEIVDRLRLREARRCVGRREVPGQLVKRGRLAREADVTERVGAIRRDVDVEDEVVDGGERLAERGARLRGVRGEDEDAVIFGLGGGGAEAQLALGAQHALADDAADVARGERHVDRREVRAEGRERDEAAGIGDVRGAAHDALLVAAAAIHRHEADLVAGGVRLDLADLGDDERLGAGAVFGEPLDLEAGEGEPIGELAGRSLAVGEEGAEPVVRSLHRDARDSTTRPETGVATSLRPSSSFSHHGGGTRRPAPPAEPSGSPPHAIRKRCLQAARSFGPRVVDVFNEGRHHAHDQRRVITVNSAMGKGDRVPW